MTAEELWAKSGLSGQYEAWAFGGAPDKLAALVMDEPSIPSHHNPA